MRALLLENIHPFAEKRLKEAGFSASTLSGALSEKKLRASLKGISLLGVRSRTALTADILKEADSLLAVGCFCVGTKNVDLEAAAASGIAVFNAPYSSTRSVAELVIGEIIMLFRRIFEKSKAVHAGIWDKSAQGAHEIRGKRLGIIGFGNIGGQVSLLAEALGMEVYYYDILEKLNLGNARRCRSMRELLRKADVVSLHVDDSPQNVGLIGDRELKVMRSGSFLLNMSRGKVVDLAALARHLRNGRLAGAAVDVYPQEPKSGQQRFRSNLQGLPNVILTPHIGGSTLEAQKEIAAYVADNLGKYVRTGDTYYNVNLPPVSLPVRKKAHRLLHIHRNVPGVMSQVTTLLASHGINIVGQYLKTTDNVGYVITDIVKKSDSDVVAALRAVRETIRLRVID
ncbi:MAG: phosphoglycerate dehydrogenase [Elusimicrobiota bacterium]